MDFGLGNLHAVVHKLRLVGSSPRLSREPRDILEATHLVLPGVGSFDAGAENLRRLGLVDALEEAVLREGTPLLGICLGMQLLLSNSEEGHAPGLGWIEGEVKRFPWSPRRPRLKVPHMGWNTVCPAQDAVEASNLDLSGVFYFLHSYYACGVADRHVAGRTQYGEDFVSAIAQDNIFGVQFHPEKSHDDGMRLLRDFLGRG